MGKEDDDDTIRPIMKCLPVKNTSSATNENVVRDAEDKEEEG